MYRLTKFSNIIFFQFGKKAKHLKLQDQAERYNLIEALKLVKEQSKRNFDETIDLQIKLNVDPKHGDQMVRGTCVMPGGLGKKIKLAVLTSEERSLTAQEAGADFFDQKQILKMIKDDQIQFEKLICTSDAMVLLKTFARQLGPRGLMPNLKAGTLISNQDLDVSVRAAKSGQIEFRVDSGKNLMAPVGKVSFDDTKILQNIHALTTALQDKKPTSIKGALIKDILLKSTMGKPLKLDINSLDQLDEFEAS